MSVLKEVYLTTFVLSYRITRWKGRMKAWSATQGVIFVQAIAALGLLSVIELITGRNLMHWPGLAACILVSLLPFNLEKQGLKYEHTFSSYRKQKRIAYYLAAATSVIVVVMLAFWALSSARAERLSGRLREVEIFNVLPVFR